jgi:hypothetical protein
VDVRIQIRGGDEVTAYNELTAWLNGNRVFCGHVTRKTSRPAEGQLGGVIEMLTVALGSGGAGAVLAQSLTEWLRNRRTDITIIVTHREKTVVVRAQGISDPQPVLQDVLRGANEL